MTPAHDSNSTSRTLPARGFSGRQWLTLNLGLLAAAALFRFGQCYPFALRYRGDASQYMRIAAFIHTPADVLGPFGPRSAGMPLFDFATRELLSVLGAEPSRTAWVDGTCLLLFIIHLGSAWLFARWAYAARLLRSVWAQLLLFVLLASSPALVGHTTSPLTDTLAVDLVLLGVLLLARGLDSKGARGLLLACVAGTALACSILVRPAFAFGAGAALLTALGVALAARWRSATVPLLALAVCAGVLAPFGMRCAQRNHAGLCLQPDSTFDSLRHAQVGLAGARMLWFEARAGKHDILPVLSDAFMLSNFYAQCRLTTLAGLGDSSLSGCLLSRPLAAPVYVVKKWVGLFDHFRFTPYLEHATPAWLRWLSRSYDVLYWLGLALLPLWLLRWRDLRAAPAAAALSPGESCTKLTRDAGLVAFSALVGYSLAMLAEHTALHVEERFSLPVLPLCALCLVAYLEHARTRYALHGVRAVRGVAVYAALAVALFIAQIADWDAHMPTPSSPRPFTSMVFG